MNPANAVLPVTHTNRGIAVNSASQAIVNQPNTAFATHSVVCEVAKKHTSEDCRAAERQAHRRELLAWQKEDIARREIAWYYTSEATDEASNDARERIYLCIQALDYREQATLALRYEPLPCPRSLEQHWGHGGYALALSLAFAGPWRPYGRPRYSLERDASDQLEEAVGRHGARVLDQIKSRAETDFAAALAAYIQMRGAAPCLLPRST